jgi:hypothetical protein
MIRGQVDYSESIRLRRSLCQLVFICVLRLDLVGPEKLPGSYGVDCD